MFLIVPYATDAPIYHFPKATLGIIATNIAVHIAWSMSFPEAAEPFAMKLGAGLHPLQWLTHNFLHADFLHLGFNMLFLWSYGIIVEGKIGWLPFLLSYLAIGTAHGALIQAAYLGAEEPSYVLGASAIIFGLMAISMLWAPKNDLSCFYLLIAIFRIFTGQFEVPIYGFALLQFFLEGISVILMFLIFGDPMSSGLLHVSGAFWGLILGVILLKARLVDCEGRDVFSLIRKRRALRDAWHAREAWLDRTRQSERLPSVKRTEVDHPDVSPEERSTKLLSRTHRAIEAGDLTGASTVYEKWMDALPGQPPRDALAGIIRALHERQEWAASVPAMRALCRLYPEKSEKFRLKLAAILIRDLDRPTEAFRHLNQISVENLDPALRHMRQKLLGDAKQRIADGVLEVEEDV